MPVQERLGVALVQMDVAKASSAKQAPVRNGAGGDEERHAYEARADCVSRAGRAVTQGCSGGGVVVGGGGAGVLGGGAGAGLGFGGGATWKPSPLACVVDVVAGDTPPDEVEYAPLIAYWRWCETHTGDNRATGNAVGNGA